MNDCPLPAAGGKAIRARWGPCLSVLIILPAMLILSGCYAGLAGIAILTITALDDSSGSDQSVNLPVEVRDVRVERSEARTSPATIRFTLIDREADPADVEILYAPPGAAATTGLPARIVGSQTALERLHTSESGVEYQREWDFASQLPLGASYQPGCRVTVRVAEHSAQAMADVGNDPPTVTVEPMEETEEYVGIVRLPFHVHDSSGDDVWVLVEHALIPGPLGGAELSPSCQDEPVPAGLPPRDLPPEPGLKWRVCHETCPGFFAFSEQHTPLDENFFWDVLGDLGHVEADVHVRLTSYDGIAWGDPFVLPEPLHVDNNERPIATLDGQAFVLNPDRSGGLPVPITVYDLESDVIRLVFQWRHAEQSFDDLPPLPPSRGELEAILADPLESALYQIASERPLSSGGQALPVSDREIRLPELAFSGSSLVEKNVRQRLGVLEILAPTGISEPIGSQHGVVSPVAALPTPDGESILVLDAPSPGSWRLRAIRWTSPVEVVSADGPEVIGSGDPTAMTRAPDGESLWVATVSAGLWSIWRVSGEGTDPTLIFSLHASSTWSPAPEGVRSLCQAGKQACLVTVGDMVARVDLSAGPDIEPVAILTGLDRPGGLVCDPADPRNVYVVERRSASSAAGDGCILKLHLDSGEACRIPMPDGSATQVGPLCVAEGGTGLLSVTDSDPDDATQELVLIDPARPGTVVVLQDLPGEVGSVALGPDGLRVAAVPDADLVVVSGGVRQRRSIVGYETGRQTVTVNRPFDPPVTREDRWRIVDSQDLQLPESGSKRAVFVWDSEDVPSGEGDFVIRVVPYDTEQGVAGTSGVPRPVSGFATSPRLLDGVPAAHYSALAAGDLDKDGDLDVIAANGDSKTLDVFVQTEPYRFRLFTNGSLGGPEVTDNVVALVVADLDGNGYGDIVAADQQSDEVRVFFQAAPTGHGFALDAMRTLGSEGNLIAPSVLQPADCDGDGDLDLIVAGRGPSRLVIFLQSEPGVFAGEPVAVSGPPDAEGPITSLALGDFDGDGRMDLVAAEPENDRLGLYLQTDPGVFAGSEELVIGGPGTTDGPVAVVAGDFDGDGRFDMASANERGNSLSIFFQRGPGVFPLDASRSLGGPGTTGAPLYLAAADLDNDGDLDLLGGNTTGGSITAFMQRPSGWFGRYGSASRPDLVVFPTEAGATPTALLTVDLDGDHDTDIVTASSVKSPLMVLDQCASGSLAHRRSPDLSLRAPLWQTGPEAVVAADVDEDGDQDLVTVDRESDSVVIFLQSRPGVFGEASGENPQSSVRLGDEDVTRGPVSVAVGDLDGDGDLDIVTANRDGNCVTIFRQAVQGKFTHDPQVDRLGGAGTTERPVSVALGDLDGDGDLDIVAAVLLSSELSIFLQRDASTDDPGRRFGSEPSVVLPASFPLTVSLADLDGDGDQDVVAGNGRDHTITMFLQMEPGEFVPHPAGPLGGSNDTRGPAAVLACDLDRDGDTDIICASMWQPSIDVFLQKPELRFEATQIQSPEHRWNLIRRPESISIGDVDGDGRLDLVCGNATEDHVTLLYQREPGRFPIDQAIRVGTTALTESPAVVVLADVDGDGRLDLVSGNRDSNNLTITYGGH